MLFGLLTDKGKIIVRQNLSMAAPLFLQQYIQVDNKEIIKAMQICITGHQSSGFPPQKASNLKSV